MTITILTERGFRFNVESPVVPRVGEYLNVPGDGGEHRLVVTRVSYDYEAGMPLYFPEGVVGPAYLSKVFVLADYR